jgi:4-hydroxybenzoate polyprenyltransferase
MKAEINLLRIRQWNKQLLILFPLIALGNSIQFIDIFKSLSIAISFSLVASSIYIFNDIQDIDFDKQDVTKSNRPITSGEISSTKAKIFSLFLLLSGVFLIGIIAPPINRIYLILLAIIYIINNVVYSKFKLKRYKLVGIVQVSLGFPIRFAIGTLVLELEISIWALVLIFQLALFFLSGKRLQTIRRRESSLKSDCVEDSEVRFWSISLATLGSSFAATYSSFITDPNIIQVWNQENLIISIVPLSLALVRYIEIVTHSRSYLKVDATEIMTKDLLLLFLTLLYVVILYSGRLNA